MLGAFGMGACRILLLASACAQLVGSALVTAENAARAFEERHVLCMPSTHYYCLGRTHVTSAQRSAHQRAAPFPHTVIDGFLPPDLLRAAVRDLHRLPSRVFRNRTSNHSDTSHRGEGDEDDDEPTHEEQMLGRLSLAIPHQLRSLPRALGATLRSFLSVAMARWVSDLVGVRDLMADPRMAEGGVHVATVGGWEGVHTPAARHPTGLVRRATGILYLNDGWDGVAWGGCLELWAERRQQRQQQQQQRCARAIAPHFNRLVVISHNGTRSGGAWFGHPEPTRRARYALVAHWYSRVSVLDVEIGKLAPPPGTVPWRDTVARWRATRRRRAGARCGAGSAALGAAAGGAAGEHARRGDKGAEGVRFFACGTLRDCASCVQYGGGGTCAWCGRGTGAAAGRCVEDRHGACPVRNEHKAVTKVTDAGEPSAAGEAASAALATAAARACQI